MAEATPARVVLCAVIATIGPASQSVEVLCKMLEAGMTCARLDLTVGAIRNHIGRARCSRTTAMFCQQPLCTALL